MTDITQAGGIVDWQDLARKTIFCVEDAPLGRYSNNIAAVLMFTDGTWCAIGSEARGCGMDDGVDVGPGVGGVRSTDFICDYLTASQMLRCGWISQALHDEIAAREQARAAEEKERIAKRLRDELAKLGAA
jgi:hypothetical protein